MSQVLGRTDDMLIIRGVNVFPSQIEEALLSFDELAPQYVIIADRGERHLDELEVRVEASRVEHQSEEVERRVRKKIEDTLGFRVSVHVVAPKKLERSQGKAVRVIDRRLVD